MNPELLLLSSRIAALVLVASLLAFGLAWWWQSLRRGSTAILSAEDAEKHRLAELHAAELKHTLTATEQQCVAALEQRDEAEREAVARRNEVNRLTEQITSLHATMAPREELDRLKQLLAERDQELWQPRPAPTEGPNPLQAELDSLRAERDQLHQKVADLDALQTRLEAASQELGTAQQTLAQEQEASARAQAEAQALRTEVEALNQKLAELTASLEKLTAEKAAAEAALQARLADLQPPAPTRSFTLTSPRLTAQPFLPPAPAVDDTLSTEVELESDEQTYPLAPARADVRDGLFRDADISSLPPDQPSLEDVHDVLTRMALELDEKEQVLAAVTQELGQREQSLSDLRREEPDAHDKLKAAEKRAVEAQKRKSEAEEDCHRARRHLRAVRRSIEVLESHPIRADNLTLIKGVKNVINSQLHAYGIFTFRQIVQWDEEDLQAFSELLSFKQRIWRDKWQDQARHLHESRYGEHLGA